MPAVELEQALVPLMPAVRVPDAPVRDSVTARKFPGKSAVNVSVEVMREEVTPIAG